MRNTANTMRCCIAKYGHFRMMRALMKPPSPQLLYDTDEGQGLLFLYRSKADAQYSYGGNSRGQGSKCAKVPFFQ
jgi:hypothetical protein